MSAREISHSFGDDIWLFESLSFSLQPGRVYALTGPSGSGKSTLLGVLAGWVTPTSGVLEREGVNRIGWVFQNPHGVSGRTAIDHVVLPLMAAGLARDAAEAKAMEYLTDFGLAPAARRPFRALSGGEAQRLMLARGLASAPDLLLIDEPTAQLDMRTADTVNDTLGVMAGRDTIVVVATHDERTKAACTDSIDLAALSRLRSQ